MILVVDALNLYHLSTITDIILIMSISEGTKEGINKKTANKKKNNIKDTKRVRRKINKSKGVEKIKWKSLDEEGMEKNKKKNWLIFIICKDRAYRKWKMFYQD